jgi:hypothetical protein
VAQKEYKVTTVDGMVRLDLADGTHTDFMPGQANKLAGLLIMAAHEAVYNNRPPSITTTFNFED